MSYKGFLFRMHTHILSRGESHFLIWFLILLFLKIQPQKGFSTQSCTIILAAEQSQTEVRISWIPRFWSPNFAREWSQGHSYKFLVVLFNYIYTFYKKMLSEITIHTKPMVLCSVNVNGSLAQELAHRVFSPLVRKTWFSLLNLMHTENCTTFWETSSPLLFQGRQLKSTSQDSWVQGNASPLLAEIAS